MIFIIGYIASYLLSVWLFTIAWRYNFDLNSSDLVPFCILSIIPVTGILIFIFETLIYFADKMGRNPIAKRFK